MSTPSDDELPQRQNPSPGVHINLGQSNFVLLTVTTEKRDPWLANETAHQLLHQTWAEAKAWLVGDYLLMPDHLHCFCAPHDLHFTIETWISYWKREFTLKHKRTEWKFQSRGWHHRLRDGENYSEKWIYGQENPFRKGLCQRIEHWPFKGRVFDLMGPANDRAGGFVLVGRASSRAERRLHRSGRCGGFRIRLEKVLALRGTYSDCDSRLPRVSMRFAALLG